MTDFEEDDNAFAEFEKYAEEVSKAADEWVKRWPNHCKACLGRGGAGYYDNHGVPGPGEYMFDACDACWAADEPKCPRCSARLKEDGELPCSSCGWNENDPDGACPEI